MTGALAGFYIVSAFFSDFGGLYAYRVLDVRADGNDSIIRYIRVASVDVYCPREIVQAVERRVVGKSPKDLVGNTDPCAVSNGAIRRALRGMPRAGGEEFVRFGIVAQCGNSANTLRLPVVNYDRLKKSHPAVAGFWSLAATIEEKFGNKDVFHDLTDEEDRALQKAGEGLLPELIAGKYDAGLKLALEGARFGFRDLLADYRGPITKAEAEALHVVTLVNAASYLFESYKAPIYPRLALLARVRGTVALNLTLDPSGPVHGVDVVSGHPLLIPSAIDAAKQWQFAAGTPAKVSVTLDYSVACWN